MMEGRVSSPICCDIRGRSRRLHRTTAIVGLLLLGIIIAPNIRQKQKMKETVNRTVLALAAAGFVTTVAIGPALADKVTAWDGRDKITVGGKKYEVSGKRTKVTIKGAAGTREQLKVGMDCKVTGPAGGEATAIAC